VSVQLVDPSYRTGMDLYERDADCSLDRIDLGELPRSATGHFPDQLIVKVVGWSSRIRDWLPAVLLTGAGTGMAFSVIAGTGASGLSSSVYATGAGVLTASRQLGGAVGVAMTVVITDGVSLSDPVHVFHRTPLISTGTVIIGTALAAMIGEMQGQPDRRVE
jgi:hypothetical protein